MQLARTRHDYFHGQPCIGVGEEPIDLVEFSISYAAPTLNSCFQTTSMFWMYEWIRSMPAENSASATRDASDSGAASSYCRLPRAVR